MTSSNAAGPGAKAGAGGKTSVGSKSGMGSKASPGGQQLERPKPLRNAVLLMYAGAVLTLLGTVADVIYVAVGGRAGLRSGHPHASASQLHATLGALITSIIFSGLIEAALWLFIARANRSGASWARVIASVLFAVSTVGFVTGIPGGSPVTSKVFAAVTWLVGLAAIWFLWQRESSAYFRAPTAPAAPAAPGGSGSAAPRSSVAKPGRPSDSG